MKNVATHHALLLAALLLGAAQASVALDLQLKGKQALVTGSTSNIGYATAEALLKEGADVIINSRTKASVDKAAATLKEATGHAPKTFVGDVTNPDDMARLVKEFPNVDVLVNNVATFMPKEFLQTTDADWEQIYKVNVVSGVRLARAYLPRMKERNWGRIIFISSESALQIPVESIHYGVTKAAQIAVARGLAETVAGTGITVNSILPGPTMDPQGQRAQDMQKRTGKSFAEAGQEFINTRRPTSLIKRFAEPDEVAALIVYVASPLSSATTGAALRVDGGVVKSAF